jgi:hypothetical protein
MFSRSDLENALKPLLDTFPGALSNSRMERIGELMAGLSIADIRRVAQSLADNSRHAPLPADVRKCMADLGVSRPHDQAATAPHQKKMISVAHLEGPWFFDDYKLFRRGRSVAECAMIPFVGNEENPLVIAAKQKHAECLQGKFKFLPAADCPVKPRLTEDEVTWLLRSHGKPMPRA